MPMTSKVTKLLAGLVIICMSYSGCAIRQVDSFLVEQATMAEASSHRQGKGLTRNWFAKARPEFVITGHRIATGDGTIIAYRIFSRGMLPFVDQAEFKKLTIFLPFSLSDGPKEVNLTDEKN